MLEQLGHAVLVPLCFKSFLFDSGTNKTPALQQRSQVKSVKRRTQNEPNETVGEHQAHSSKERRLAANPSSKGSTGLHAGAASRPRIHLMIANISLNDNIRLWHLKVWTDHLYMETPQRTRNRKYYFYGKLRDESGLVIYFMYFGTFLKSMEHLSMMEESTEYKPLYMWHVKVQEQDKEYRGLARGESEFKLLIDEHSKICRA
ncbi:uncharacterized protein LOC110984521 [Acanthaster planci]|uniref:Uncharacterized protein LOC110984521 n=1 Tax=Acanthaster planci TaxID=133434 RepID=A0A8B7Z6A5_ACAPL|nr:uncharacterized protein LOC110984521 [Acanthaster planci]